MAEMENLVVVQALTEPEAMAVLMAEAVVVQALTEPEAMAVLMAEAVVALLLLDQEVPMEEMEGPEIVFQQKVQDLEIPCLGSIRFLYHRII